MENKICFKCEINKPISHFYKHKQMADGHLNKCIDCTKKDSDKREKVLRLDPLWVEKEKERAREKYNRLGYKDLYKPTKEQKKLSMDRYKNKYPEKISAKIAMGKTRAFVKGNHLHHWSYNEAHYKDTIELSIADHNTVHRYIIYDQERKMYRDLSGLLLDSRKSHCEYISLILKKEVN